jgi:hypothetical protein
MQRSTTRSVHRVLKVLSLETVTRAIFGTVTTLLGGFTDASMVRTAPGIALPFSKCFIDAGAIRLLRM